MNKTTSTIATGLLALVINPYAIANEEGPLLQAPNTTTQSQTIVKPAPKQEPPPAPLPPALKSLLEPAYTPQSPHPKPAIPQSLEKITLTFAAKPIKGHERTYIPLQVQGCQVYDFTRTQYAQFEQAPETIKTHRGLYKRTMKVETELKQTPSNSIYFLRNSKIPVRQLTYEKVKQ